MSRIVKDMFLLDIGPDVIDLGEMTQSEWDFIGDIAKELIAKKYVYNVSHAYIAAFLQWSELQKDMLKDFEKGFDQMN